VRPGGALQRTPERDVRPTLACLAALSPRYPQSCQPPGFATSTWRGANSVVWLVLPATVSGPYAARVPPRRAVAHPPARQVAWRHQFPVLLTVNSGGVAMATVAAMQPPLSAFAPL